MGFPGGSVVKTLPAIAGDTDLTPGLGRSPGKGNGNPLQYSCLENSMDRGVWWAQSLGSQRVGHNWVTCMTMPTFGLFTLSSYLKFFIIGKFFNIAAA